MRSKQWVRGTVARCLVPACLGWHLLAIDLARGQEKAPPSEKTAVKEFVSWAEVMERLSERTGLPFIGGQVPEGAPDAGLKKDAPVPELIDGINERLMPRRLVVIRRDKSITVAPTDEGINPGQL